MNKVFVVGSLNIDQTIRAHSLPRPGETVHGSDATFRPGGKGGNQAVAAARAGAEVHFTGAVGNDHHGKTILDVLDGSGVRTAGLRVVEDSPTGTAVIAVDDAGNNQILVCPGANFRLTPNDVEAGLAELQDGDVLVLQLEIPAPLVRHAARLAKSRGALVLLNAAPAPRQTDSLFENIDLLIVNEQEIMDLAATCGMPATDYRDLVTALPAVLGPAILCTAGETGSFAVIRGGLVQVSAPTVVARDTTGAGDTYVGYLAAALAAAPGDLLAAMELAAQASALTVQRPGAMESIPWRAGIASSSPSPSAQTLPAHQA
ncbi:ribokinase [Arthrobacter sp. HMWF013]|uniref:ribokinase n=1 Tax=Arthrobacter sp. HMWF013 TaxID=2056849 RepID=UPI000D36A81B|nr:ribokinase [Arthrobacter sp. HMWF013]PTT68943.1 ribokinase [Arthrobacter sp. HMWF013]